VRLKRIFLSPLSAGYCYGEAEMGRLSMNFEDYVDSLFPFLANLKRDESAEVFFDVMSGALVWTDERIQGLTPVQLGCLRAIHLFRTSLIIDSPDLRFQGLWDRLKRICPNWMGFDPSRCQPSEELAKKYRQWKGKFG
jgi:hypothetical protein